MSRAIERSNCTYVCRTLKRHYQLKWKAAVARHSLPVPYGSISPCIREWVQTSFSIQLPWDILLKQRSAVRLRCGLLDLGHASGKRTRARAQTCIFCGELVSQLWLHVFCSCTRWNEERGRVMNCLPSVEGARGWTIMLNILCSSCDSSQYSKCIEFVDAVVQASDVFWQNMLSLMRV